MSDSIHICPGQTGHISTGRFEQSPYLVFYKNDATVLGVAAGRYYASDNGEDVIATYRALRSEAVLFDLPEKPWQIEGPDVVPFLEKLFSRRIDNLRIERGRYAIACTSEGGTYMDGILFRLTDQCFWYVQADGAFEEWVIAHREGLEVDLGDFIDLEKLGYIARVALLQANTKTLMYGIKCPSHTPHYGAEVWDDSRQLGEVTTNAWSPNFDCGIGYIKFHQAGGWAGKSLLMKTKDNDLVACEIVELPFYDAEKRIPRGLEN